MSATQPRPRDANHGSRTLTVTNHEEPEAGPSQPRGLLKLRGDKPKARKPRVVWADDTVDNEGMGKKKSKICCIYHKPRAFDESSSESDCSSSDEHDHSAGANGRREQNPKGKGKGQQLRRRDGAGGGGQIGESGTESSSSESEGGGGDGRAQPIGKSKRKPKPHRHDHPHGAGDDACGSPDGQPSSANRPAPNKYDVQPRGGK